MSSINKYSFLHWILGVALVAFSGIALALQVTDPAIPYVDGDALNASKMNSIRNAVNDNDTQITNIKNTSAVLGAACVGNNTSDIMVRVGPICVDLHKASIFQSTAAGGTEITTLITTAVPTCTTAGTDTGGSCNIVAQSRAAATPIDGQQITWAQAVRACTNAGKRLLTPGEWMAAFTSGLVTGIETNQKQEYVDLVALTASVNVPGKMQVGYIGNTTAAGGVNANSSTFLYDQVASIPNVFNFRCAR